MPEPGNRCRSFCGHRVQDTQGRAAAAFSGRGPPTETLPGWVPGQRLLYRRQERISRARPIVGSARQPAGATAVQTGTAHVAVPTTPTAKRLPAMPLVAPTDNIRVFPRWSPRAILLAPNQSNIQWTLMDLDVGFPHPSRRC